MGDADASSAAVRIFSSSSSEVFPSPVREEGGSPFSPRLLFIEAGEMQMSHFFFVFLQLSVSQKGKLP